MFKCMNFTFDVWAKIVTANLRTRKLTLLPKVSVELYPV